MSNGTIVEEGSFEDIKKNELFLDIYNKFYKQTKEEDK
jgi:hypothetical protein